MNVRHNHVKLLVTDTVDTDTECCTLLEPQLKNKKVNKQCEKVKSSPFSLSRIRAFIIIIIIIIIIILCVCVCVLDWAGGS